MSAEIKLYQQNLFRLLYQLEAGFAKRESVSPYKHIVKGKSSLE